MKRIAFRQTIRAALLVAIVSPTAMAAAPADGPSPEAIVATRQAGFKAMGAAMKALKTEFQAPAPANDTMLKAATTIAETATGQGKLFPSGSGPSLTLKTAALPGIWTDRTTFDKQMAALVTESAKLVAVVKGGDVAAIKAQQAVTGATCGGCHKQFRAES